MRLQMGRLVIATHNAGKLREMEALLAPYGIEVVSAGALGLAEPAETETTFAGNARIKAHAAAQATGLPALSDDSGLSVEALDGAPGVYTADWADAPGGRDFGMAMERVHEELAGRQAVPPWRAKFHCVLCLALPDHQDEVYEGEVSGQLTWPPRGTRGFGFDPMFLPDGETETFGEMDPDRKHGMSHRAKAFARFVRDALDQ